MTIEDIAQKLEISKSTVSRALRGCYGVKADTRERCLKMAGELGYHIPAEAESHNVALILPAKSIEDVHELAHRSMLVIGNEIDKLDWQIRFIVIPMQETAMLDDIKTWPIGLSRANLDCCIVEGMISRQARLLLAKRFSEHVVMLSRHYLHDGLSGVGIDNYAGGNFAANKVLDAGHSRIGWIGSLGSRDISSERYYGVCNCLKQAGAELTAEIWLDERLPLDFAVIDHELQTNMPAEPDKIPTAWISSTDWLGAMVILYFESKKLFCPMDFSMISFDDTKIAEALVHRILTSVVSPITKIATGAVQMLASHWQGSITEPTAWLYPFEYRSGCTLVKYRQK